MDQCRNGRREGGTGLMERLRFTFTLNGKREFVPREQVFSLLVVYCSLFLHLTTDLNFIYKNCLELFLSAHFHSEKFST